jgi:hypothetical protein
VRYFFYFSTLLKCVNATKIFLVLKVETLTTMNNFRPISCCNMMYKCISKVIMNRSKGIFPEVIGLVQTIFFREDKYQMLSC